VLKDSEQLGKSGTSGNAGGSQRKKGWVKDREESSFRKNGVCFRKEPETLKTNCHQNGQWYGRYSTWARPGIVSEAVAKEREGVCPSGIRAGIWETCQRR